MSATEWIIIPCYNEQAVLRDTVSRVLHTGLQIVIVDDASTPPAAGLLHGLPVHIIRHPLNLGQGAALQTGMDFARSQG
ncbi:MAG: glycosyltransferase, partial [Oligosphaeraceae bacterium]|nr:glycosyltransferase [Oligosphaeraceae bacterium]